jgi:hypothetical protein
MVMVGMHDGDDECDDGSGGNEDDVDDNDE